jgi:hypothetical protein
MTPGVEEGPQPAVEFGIPCGGVVFRKHADLQNTFLDEWKEKSDEVVLAGWCRTSKRECRVIMTRRET